MPSGVYVRTKPVSVETRRKMSLALMGNKRTLGYKFTVEQIANMKASRVIKLGKDSPSWRGGETKKRNDSGYVYNYIGKGKYRAKHNLLVEKHIGRPLEGKEMIHHINFKRDDNRLENLYLFKSKAPHTRYHRFLKRHGLNGTNNELTSNLYIHQNV